MKASDLIVKCLENEDVKYIFGLPGEENIDLLESLNNSKIKFITARHEQGAAFMADVYGRLTGKAAVCLSTLGPGATNLVTGVADAYLDRVPLVAITGQSGLKKTHKESHQYVDVMAMFKPITKWNARIMDPEMIPEVIRKAFRLAQMEKPGSTHIELPEDVAKEETNLKPLPKIKSPEIRPRREEIMEAVRLIEKANAPIILAGNGVVRQHAAKELTEFARKSNIPVANTFMSKGVLSSDNKLNISTIGLQAHDYVMCGFEKADLVITVGYDIVEYSPEHWNPSRNKKIIHIDSIGCEVDGHYIVNVELVGSIHDTLKKLSKYAKGKKHFDYAFRLKRFVEEERKAYCSDDSYPVKPQRIICDMRHVLGEDDILISDVGAHKLWIARMYKAYKPNTVIISNGFATMGISVPGAIGAKLAFPDKKVIAATGDGGFMMNSQELETATRLGLSFTVVIFSDSKYGQIEQHQLKRFKRTTGIDFTNPDFVMYAESFGCKGVRIKKAKDLLPALKKAVSSKGISVIEVPVDYTENMKLSEKLGHNICPI